MVKKLTESIIIYITLDLHGDLNIILINMKKKLIFKILLLIVSNLLFSQEALKSIEEEYYDFLSLQGIVERPTLGYKTLSDSVWSIPSDYDTEHIWKNNNLGTTKILYKSNNQGKNWFTKGFFHGLKFKIYKINFG